MRIKKTTKKEIAKEWTYVDDAYYSLVNTGEGFPILVKRLQNSDYDDILTNLIDTSLRPDTVAVQNAAYNPDAILPDNMFQMGVFLWKIGKICMNSSSTIPMRLKHFTLQKNSR